MTPIICDGFLEREVFLARKDCIFLVDDEDTNLVLFERALSGEQYELWKFHDGQEVLEVLHKGQLPDLVVLDVMMPHMDGFSLCSIIKNNPATAFIPVVLVTGLEDFKDKVRGLEAGADDFITKPFHPAELRARVKSLLRLKHLHDELAYKNSLLEDRKLHLEKLVEERTEELESLTIGIVSALEMVNALRDTDTGLHIKRVCSYSHAIAIQMGLPPEFALKIKRYASMHDVGKVGIPDAILKKKGKLTDAESQEMRKHTVYGYDLLVLARADKIAQNIALYHHERYDGKGYPKGLRDDDIPLEARVVALADVFDALTTRRCYKEPIPFEDAKKIIAGERGLHFDPKVADSFFGATDDIMAIFERYKDPE